jgi:hypothetical protein
MKRPAPTSVLVYDVLGSYLAHITKEAIEMPPSLRELMEKGGGLG